MLNIASVLNFIKQGVIAKDPRFHIIDTEHVLDTVTGVKLHMYSDWFKLTHNDEVIATMRDFDPLSEQPLVWEIKNIITPVEVLEHYKLNYKEDIKNRRKKLSDYFENPMPIESKDIQVEPNTVPYTG